MRFVLLSFRDRETHLSLRQSKNHSLPVLHELHMHLTYVGVRRKKRSKLGSQDKAECLAHSTIISQREGPEIHLHGCRSSCS